jgi:hypothetical protein
VDARFWQIGSSKDDVEDIFALNLIDVQIIAICLFIDQLCLQYLDLKKFL